MHEHTNNFAMPSASEIVPALVDQPHILDHGKTGARFHATIKCGDSVEISPSQLLMSSGCVDASHLNISGIKIHNAVIADATPTARSGLVILNGTEPLQTTHRVTVVGNGQNDMVHACATSANMTEPHTLTIGPCEATRGTHPFEGVKQGVARAARWAGVEPGHVDIHADIEPVTRAGETRHLVDCVASPESSPITRLFQYNSANPQFMDGAYMQSKRKVVTSGGTAQFVVHDDHLTKAKELLKENLTQKHPFAVNGLHLKHVNLTGKETGPMHVDFTVERTPLTQQTLASGMRDVAPATHVGLITVDEAQTAFGDKSAKIDSILPESQKADAVFGPARP